MTEVFDLVIRTPRVIIPGEGEVARSIGVRNGRIAAIEPLQARLAALETWDLETDVVLMPGLVDTHVHVNEPGHTEWEGFRTATTAAALGGITTIMDMPLNSIPVTVDVDALELKRRAAKGQCHIDVGFVGGVIPGNLDQLAPLHRAGVFGFKCFLVNSGLKEFPEIDVLAMQEALVVLGGLGVPLFIHAENDLAAGARRCPSQPQVRRLSPVAPVWIREPGHRSGDRGSPPNRGPGPHLSSVEL